MFKKLFNNTVGADLRVRPPPFNVKPYPARTKFFHGLYAVWNYKRLRAARTGHGKISSVPYTG